MKRVDDIKYNGGQTPIILKLKIKKKTVTFTISHFIKPSVLVKFKSNSKYLIIRSRNMKKLFVTREYLVIVKPKIFFF